MSSSVLAVAMVERNRMTGDPLLTSGDYHAREHAKIIRPFGRIVITLQGDCYGKHHRSQ